MTAIPAPDTEEWQEWRRGGVGASEMAAILGIDPWRGEYALALDKRGLVPPRVQSAAMAWGHRMEQVGADEYAARTGRVLLPGVTVTDPRWPHVYATPDRRIAGEPGLVELKWTTRWDVPPRHVIVQCQVQMGLTDTRFVDVVRMGPFGEPQWHTVERDEEIAISLLELGEAWYLRHVVGEELPPVDGSQDTSRYLDRLAGPAEWQADVDQTSLALRLRDTRSHLQALESEEAWLVNALKQSMAGGGVLTGDGFRITWKKGRPFERPDWKLVAGAYRMALVPHMDAEQLDTLVSLHTETVGGRTPFIAKFDTEEEQP